MKKIFALVLFAFLSCDLLIAQSLHWPPHQGTSSDNMGCVFVIYINDELEVNDQLELGVFNGETCKGSALMSTNFLGLNVWDVTVYGDNGDQFTFRLFDHSLGQELDYLTCDESVTYAQLGYGNHMEPYPLHFTGSPTPQPTTYELPITGYGAGNPGGYYLIASPVTEEITPSAENGFLTDAFDLYYFDQNGDAEGNEWINYEPNTFTIQSKKGYLYASQTNTQLQFAGTACTDGNVELEYSTTNPSTFMHGWNLIGNPLAVDATISKACYVMNEGGTELEAAASGKLIPAMNGVFVKAEGAGESVTFTPSNNSGEGAKIDINVLKDRGATIDRAIVCLGEGGTLPKFMLHPENTKIYIEQGGDDYAVVSSNEDEIPVSFKAASNGTYTLNIAVQNTEMDYLHLIDNLAGNDVDLLANPNYTFEANTGDYACRFTLVLRNTTGIEEHFAFFNGHNWTVSNQGEATLQVIDVTGRVVSTKTIDGTTQLDVNAAPGVYMFRLVNGNDVKVQKVVVR